MNRHLLSISVFAVALGLTSGCGPSGGGKPKTQTQIQSDGMKGASGTGLMDTQSMEGAPPMSEDQKQQMQNTMQRGPGGAGGAGGAGLAPQGGAPKTPGN